MNILFLTLSRISSLSERSIYTDLLSSLVELGNEVYIVSALERRFGEKTQLIEEGRIHILRVKTLNIQKTNIFEKGIGTLLLERQYLNAINKYWGEVAFELVVYTTPPITFNKVIESIKKQYNAKSYLLLKDIFPQNAVDLGMFKKNGFFYKLFRKKENQLYAISDKIGCMSPANVEYLLNSNPQISPFKVEVFPNSVIPSPHMSLLKKEKDEIIASLGIEPGKVIALYGGNLGKPQGIDFLLEVLKDNEHRKDCHFIIIGSGTEYSKLEEWFSATSPQNAILKAGLPKDEYDKIARVADIGLIFLDHRFTIPNYPSRLISYLESAIPVLIASDPNTDIGRIAETKGYGLWCESNSVSAFRERLESLITNQTLREEMGKRGRKYFEEELDVRKHLHKLY